MVKRTKAAWAEAAVALAGAVFFAALGVGVVSSRMAMHPLLGWLLRGFIGLMFGSLSAAGVAHAARCVGGAGGVVPSALEGRCLGCGTGYGHEARCAVCGTPTRDVRARVQVAPSHALDALLVATGSASVVCLGVFLVIGPWIDGERRGWVLVATLAVSLLLLGVGGAGLVGALLALRRRWGAPSVLTLQAHEGTWRVAGQGTARGTVLLHFEGECGLRAPLEEATSAEAGYRGAHDRRLAETLAIFEAAGLLSLWQDTLHRWTYAPTGGVTQRVERKVWVEAGRAPGEGLRSPLVDAVARFVGTLLEEDAMTLATLVAELTQAPTLRAQCLEHAEALRGAGVRVVPGRVEAVHRALVAYHQVD